MERRGGLLGEGGAKGGPALPEAGLGVVEEGLGFAEFGRGIVGLAHFLAVDGFEGGSLVGRGFFEGLGEADAEVEHHPALGAFTAGDNEFEELGGAHGVKVSTVFLHPVAQAGEHGGEFRPGEMRLPAPGERLDFRAGCRGVGEVAGAGVWPGRTVHAGAPQALATHCGLRRKTARGRVAA